MTSGKRHVNGYTLAFLGALTAFVPFALQYNYIINIFYYYGATYFDAGLFANMLWHNDLWLRTPFPRSDFSYMGVHFSPFLIVVNLLSWVVPSHMVEFFGFFMGCIYASLAAGMYAALLACVKPGRLLTVLLLAVLAVAYAFNGVVMQGVWMPHFEYAIPSAILVFLLCLRLGRTGWANLFFVLLLSLREDAGLHLIAVLGLLTLLRLYHERSLAAVKPELAYMACAFVWSLFAMHMIGYVKALNGVQESVMENIYTGNPPYAHLTWKLLESRLPEIFHLHAYMWLAFLITINWALITRNVWLLVGFAAYTPWLFITWAAYNGNTGVLYAYYCFPLVLSMGWPVLAALWRHGSDIPPAAKRQMLVLQVLLAVAGLACWDEGSRSFAFAPTYWAQWGGYEMRETPCQREAVRSFSETVGAPGEPLGTIMIEDNAMSLAVGSRTEHRGENILPLDEARTADTIVYISHYDAVPEQVASIQLRDKLDHHYCVAGSPLCLFSNHARDELGSLSWLLVDSPPPKK